MNGNARIAQLGQELEQVRARVNELSIGDLDGLSGGELREKLRQADLAVHALRSGSPTELMIQVAELAVLDVSDAARDYDPLLMSEVYETIDGFE
ncbi:hypothetical protein BIV57_11835 [Mangrovactinospora gilvigrisea]|uniref:Uncharacterized protein n=1 Tax=Mangrovactinospora gilvigrisea TaxID=1428644 RepID=A0A1J7BF08_9ACTN|nr:hypothetical protein [Mangrovactinospora gilvigrisea]OIV37267.1 hypothetical protein BIV57_11835 [Mangrovactinospora gilvigrisea]